MTRTHVSAFVAGLMAVPLLWFPPNASAQTAPEPAPAGDARPAAPERFRNFVLDTAGPVWLVEAVAYAGIAQARDTPPEWGGGAKGFGKRYASLLGQGAIQEAVTYGLSEAMSVDSRFRKSGKHGFFPRAGDALLQSVTSRRANGDRVVSVPLLAGYAAGGLGMMTWYPDGYTNKDGFGYGGVALASRAAVNLIREFIVRR